MNEDLDLKSTVGALIVSTVYLHVNHGYGGKPLWYETMVFPVGKFDDLYCDRYETIDEAKIGHEKAIEWAMKEQSK